LLASLPARSDSLKLPKPSKSLHVEDVWIAAPGLQQPIVKTVSFTLDKGAGLGVIGPSASGKSTLARGLVGAWAHLRGNIRIDGAALDQWSADDLGSHIGYLPQDIELLDGTVAQNIARFDPDARAATIIASAAAARVHDLILRLPQGYETRIGEGGSMLSARQRQRIALARALYNDPFLIVLDEPNSNLDADGDEALTQAIFSIRARGGIAIVIAHRPSALAALDQILVMGAGQLQTFGPKGEVLRAISQSPSAPAASTASRFKVISEGTQGAE
jgi:ABC-type protease/lipase transport system fused ATPase/permease subunit